MTQLRILTGQELDRLTETAAGLPRRRRNLNLHPVLEDPVQRLLNAMEPTTYVRPHRHARPEGWELMMPVRGSFAILTFDDAGVVTGRVDLKAGGEAILAEIPAFTWHAVVVLESGTVMFEVKPGPYRAVDDKDFAPWAPVEGGVDAPRFVDWYRRARPGDRPPLGG